MLGRGPQQVAQLAAQRPSTHSTMWRHCNPTTSLNVPAHLKVLDSAPHILQVPAELVILPVLQCIVCLSTSMPDELHALSSPAICACTASAGVARCCPSVLLCWQPAGKTVCKSGAQGLDAAVNVLLSAHLRHLLALLPQGGLVLFHLSLHIHEVVVSLEPSSLHTAELPEVPCKSGNSKHVPEQAETCTSELTLNSLREWVKVFHGMPCLTHASPQLLVCQVLVHHMHAAKIILQFALRH